MSTCSVADCDKPAARGGLCWGHCKRRSREQPVAGALGRSFGARYESQMERLREAALAYADADGEEEFAAAEERLRKASAAAGAAALAELARAARTKRKTLGGRPKKVEPADVIEMMKKTGSVQVTASRLKVSQKTVQRVLAAHKVR